MAIFAIEFTGSFAVIGLLFSVVIFSLSIFLQLLALGFIPDSRRVVIDKVLGRTAVWSLINLMVVLPVVVIMFVIAQN